MNVFEKAKKEEQLNKAATEVGQGTHWRDEGKAPRENEPESWVEDQEKLARYGKGQRVPRQSSRQCKGVEHEFTKAKIWVRQDHRQGEAVGRRTRSREAV